ncbi:lipid kinase YegS [Oceanospirillum sanctuarii]|uniref:lipid kinase YegS n=1 Tax=Oceanospirillum sanctuarii TaxID=1434821 RepID=UPI000A3BA8D1|nr:lipid kinase YegS [Oceanospirillum sanctuarii]
MSSADNRYHIRIILHGKEAQNIALRDAVRLLRDHRYKIDVRVTWEEGDARRLAREARQLGVHTVVAAGGDGTLNEVVNGLMAADARLEMPSLGLIPLGTANDFAMSCRIPLAPLEALRLITEISPVAVDLGRANQRYFLNLASGGFGTQITTSTPDELKRALGSLAYLLTGMSKFTSIAAVEGRIKAPDFDWQGAFMVLGVGNGRQAGGGHELCPDALLDDGLLDLNILPKTEQQTLTDTLQYFMLDNGAVLQNLMIHRRVPWLEIEAEQSMNINIDGEPLSGQHFRFEIHTAALKMHLPRRAPLLSKNAGDEGLT